MAWFSSKLAFGLAALFVSAAGPAYAQTAPPAAATSSVSASADAEAPAEAEAVAAPASDAEAVKAKADAAMNELEAEAAKAEARAKAKAAEPKTEAKPAPKAAEATPEPSSTPGGAKTAPAAAKAKGDGASKVTSGDQAKNVLVRNIADAPVGKRPWFLSGTLAFRTLVVNDQDPANDQSLSWIAQAGHKLGGGFTVFAQLRLTQRFVAEEGDSAFRFENVQGGVNYIHRVDLKDLLGVDRQLSFFHRASLVFPTSRASQRQDLIFAPRLLTRGRVKVIGDLYFGFAGLVEYRWHEFAERAGLMGGTNTQAYMAAQGAFEYQVLQSKDWGIVVLGVDTYGGARFQYANRDGDRATLPLFGWDLYAQYVPFPSLAVGISMEQGDDVFNNGTWKLEFFDRETTQFAISVTGRY